MEKIVLCFSNWRAGIGYTGCEKIYLAPFKS
jgi:hypothetical protein